MIDIVARINAVVLKIGEFYGMTTTERSLAAGECRITFTKDEREILHLLLAIAREHPEVLIGEETARTQAGRIMAAHVARIQAKLPKRGSGTY